MVLHDFFPYVLMDHSSKRFVMILRATELAGYPLRLRYLIGTLLSWDHLHGVVGVLSSTASLSYLQ